MKHYWNSKLDDDFSPKIINIYFAGKIYNFFSSEDVFSKDRADYGSITLLESTLNEIPDLPYRVLDMGCGYGFLGVMISLLKPKTKVEMTDISEKAVELCKMNVEKYSLIDKTKIMLGDKYSECSGKYNMIVCNPPVRTGKENIYLIFKMAKDFLYDKGKLIIVLKKKHGAPSAKKFLEEIFGNCKILKRDKGYYILQSTKNPALD